MEVVCASFGKKLYTMTIFNSSQNWLHVKIKNEGGCEQILTQVYGPAKAHERHKLWDFLKSIATFDTPWIIFGDFNLKTSSNFKLSRNSKFLGTSAA